MRYLEIIASCAEIATRAHTLCYKTKKHATRKDGVTPFIVHPARVASLMTHRSQTTFRKADGNTSLMKTLSIVRAAFIK